MELLSKFEINLEFPNSVSLILEDKKFKFFDKSLLKGKTKCESSRKNLSVVKFREVFKILKWGSEEIAFNFENSFAILSS